MAGHSKWANIRYRKERADNKKSKLFSRLSKEIINAVKQGGKDPKTNSRLRQLIQKAKEFNLPNENIERNIKKASSEGQVDYIEMTFEIYGYGGVGIVLEVMTDNKNRTLSEIRIVLNRYGGNVANLGSVSFNFRKMGVIKIKERCAFEDELFALVTEEGALDFDKKEGSYIVKTQPKDFLRLKDRILKENIRMEEAALEMIPSTFVSCSDQDAENNMNLIEKLEELDDVDALYHNMRLQGRG